MTDNGDQGIDRERLLARLAALPGGSSDVAAARVVRAPGRVNLIGEHTDYNDGYVLPAAIDLEIAIAFEPTQDGLATITPDGPGATETVDVLNVGTPRGGWTDYVAGTAREMSRAGLGVVGFRGLLASTLPAGAGLSSSAALELASAWAMSPIGGPAAPALEVARIAQRAENQYVGMMCGLMDQFASACGVAGAAVMLDCRTLDHRPVMLPADLVICVVHSGVPRALVTSAYNERRADCERAVAIVQQSEPSVRALRDVDLPMLERSCRQHGCGRRDACPSHHRGERPGAPDRGRVQLQATCRRSASCSPPVTRRCGTCSRSAARSSTCWWSSLRPRRAS